MRLIILITIILLSSCANRKGSIANRQQAVAKEMEEVKAVYYKKIDSLESVREADTIPSNHNEIAGIAEGEKTATLIKLQKEYDSLEAELKKY